MATLLACVGWIYHFNRDSFGFRLVGDLSTKLSKRPLLEFLAVADPVADLL